MRPKNTTRIIIKNDVVNAIYKEIDVPISYFDIFSVVNIFIDELTKELKKKKEIKIPNFGKLHLKKFPPKIHINVNTGKREKTRSWCSLRLNISRHIVDYIMNGAR